jgi:hypothetical protein
MAAAVYPGISACLTPKRKTVGLYLKLLGADERINMGFEPGYTGLVLDRKLRFPLFKSRFVKMI